MLTRRMQLRSGQTIMELLIAFFVIAVGLLAAVTLVYSNLNLVQRDMDDVIAVNLAREGIELAKNVRDSNWLNTDAFDLGLVNPADVTDVTAVPVWSGPAMTMPLPTAPSFDFTVNAMTDASPMLNVVVTPDGVYANNVFGAGGTATSFKRMLTFHSICSDDSVVNSGVCGPGLTKIGVRVESRVHITEKGTSRDLVLYDDLYDWR